MLSGGEIVYAKDRLRAILVWGVPFLRVSTLSPADRGLRRKFPGCLEGPWDLVSPHVRRSAALQEFGVVKLQLDQKDS